MPDRILVPLDGAELAARAVPWADALAGGLGAEVELVTVIVPDIRTEALEAEVEMNRRIMPDRPEEETVARRYEERVERESAAAIRTIEAARTSLRQAAGVITTVLRGEPGDAIVAHARELSSRLVVMATHARLGLERAFLGSVAGEVLQRSHIPVILVNPHLPLAARAPGRILVALDGSPLADAILPFVGPIAQQLGSTLVLFTVEELPPVTLPVQGANIPLGGTPDRPPAEVAQHLEQVAANLQSQGVRAEIAADTGRNRGETIARAALDQRCDLIAMSTHGRNGVGRWIVGSVTDTVIRTAELPVLAICPAGARDAHPIR
jgi:nucleotide-binding universal stress UspA family protein